MLVSYVSLCFVYLLDDCYDVDPKELCKRRKRTGYCSVKAWEDYLIKRCARTCGFCGEANYSVLKYLYINKLIHLAG